MASYHVSLIPYSDGGYSFSNLAEVSITDDRISDGWGGAQKMNCIREKLNEYCRVEYGSLEYKIIAISKL